MTTAGRADFIAQHVDGAKFLRVQLKSRLTFCRKYVGKGWQVAFPHNGHWYLYSHDELLKCVQAETGMARTKAWIKRGEFHYLNPSQRMLQMLESYRLGHHSRVSETRGEMSGKIVYFALGLNQT